MLLLNVISDHRVTVARRPSRSSGRRVRRVGGVFLKPSVVLLRRYTRLEMKPSLYHLDNCF
jgi:hypothetical protein